MGHRRDDSSERGAWTPFVGVALAALTAGSLVVFSVVAQRTSLDGFSARGVTAVTPSQEAPSSITLPNGRQASVASTGSEDAGAATATALLTPPPPTPALIAATDVADAPEPAPVAARSGGPTVGSSSGDGFQARFEGGGQDLTLFRDGETRAAGQDREAHDGDRGNGKAKSKDKSKSKAKSKSKSKSKNHKDADRRGHRKGKASNRNKGRGHSGGHGSSGGSAGSPHAAPARRSSRPSPAPKPQRASHPKPKASPPGHSDSNGNGHSQGRGRGHGRG